MSTQQNDVPHNNAGNGALAGVRVLDLSRVLGGPMAAQTLGDHGADVVKIEPPRGDETREMGPPFKGDASSIFINVNRNKRGLSLDLASPAGREVFLRLLEHTDVIVDNFKPGTMEKWGIGYDVLGPRFPRLIHASITGFGPDGPLGGAPGYDVIVQAWGGLISTNGSKESGPMRLGTPLVDMTAGNNIVIGVLLALFARERTGRGQHVDVSLYDSAIGFTHPHSANYFLSGKVPGLMGNDNPNLSPYSMYRTRKSVLYIGVGNDFQFARLCEVIGCQDLVLDERFKTNAKRVVNNAELTPLLEAAIADLDGAELCYALLKAKVPAGLVQNIPEALNHPHTLHRQMQVELEGYRWTGVPVKLSATPGTVRRIPPDFNQHADEVLRERGFTDAEIAELRARGVVGQSRVKHHHREES